jgi:hypothetical protein
MDKMLQHIWPLEPGICVTLLGVEALVITLLPVRFLDHKPVKFCAVLLCFVLAVAEILVVKRDRRETNEQHTHDMQEIFFRFGGLHSDLVAIQANAPATQQSRSLPADSLKRRALDLSNEMLQFLVSREIPPGYGQGGYGEGPFGGKPSDTKQYDKETLGDYFKVFEPRVSDIREEFKKRGITDERLEAEYPNPVNTYSVRAIAERIGTMAKRLPE